jgi:hypothetical protein
MKRRETLLSLLDALSQLTEDPELRQGKRLFSSFGKKLKLPIETDQQPSFEADRDVRKYSTCHA